MAEKAKQLRRLLSKNAQEKRNNLEKEKKPSIRKAVSNKIDFDPLKFFEEKNKIEIKQHNILNEILSKKEIEELEEDVIENEKIEKPKFEKIVLNKKEKPKMSEERKKNLIKRMNTAIENTKLNLEKNSVIKPSNNILQRAQMFEENNIISQKEN